MHVPPPVHGASMMGKYIAKSNLIKSEKNIKIINLSTSISIDEVGRKIGLGKMSRYVAVLWKVFNSLIFFRPDLTYITITAKGKPFFKDFFIISLAKLTGSKTILHFHNKGVSEKQDNYCYNIFYKLTFTHSKVILLSNLLFSDIKKYVDKKNVYFCPNGIPNINCSLDKKESKIIRILFLSNLIESKGVYVLLEALKILKNRNINFLCNFVGGQSDISEAEFNNRLADLGLLNDVVYLGKKYGDDKNEIYLNSDIFVLPSYYHNECFPLVILEAMQFGLPIISTQEGAIPEIIEDNITGFVIERENTTALVDKIEFLVNNPKQRKEMGASAKTKYLSHYTMNMFEQKMNAIFKNELYGEN